MIPGICLQNLGAWPFSGEIIWASPYLTSALPKNLPIRDSKEGMKDLRREVFFGCTLRVDGHGYLTFPACRWPGKSSSFQTQPSQGSQLVDSEHWLVDESPQKKLETTTQPLYLGRCLPKYGPLCPCGVSIWAKLALECSLRRGRRKSEVSLENDFPNSLAPQMPSGYKARSHLSTVQVFFPVRANQKHVNLLS